MVWDLETRLKNTVPVDLIHKFVICDELDIRNGIVFVANLASAKSDNLLRALCKEFQDFHASAILPNVWCWDEIPQNQTVIDPILGARGSGVLCFVRDRKVVNSFTGSESSGLHDAFKEFFLCRS